MTTLERCELTDLLPDQCGCRNHRGGQTPNEPDLATRAQLLLQPGWIEARWPGHCAHCGDPFPEGAAITIETGLGWRAECCP